MAPRCCEMKPYTRKATVFWVGSGERGQGAVSTPSDVLKQAPYSSGNGRNRRRTNPPELIAAAQASSFSITLANELGEAGYRPRQIDTTATVTMESIAGWTLTQIHLDVIATVRHVPQYEFIDAALRAKANCPIARSLNANISMRAHLKDGAAPESRRPHRKPAATQKNLSQRNKRRRIRSTG